MVLSQKERVIEMGNVITEGELRENDLIREIIRLKSFVHRTFCEQGHHHRNCKSAHRLINCDDFRDQTQMIFEDIATRKAERAQSEELGSGVGGTAAAPPADELAVL